MIKNFTKFQGNLKKKKYFEGYYYKITSKNAVISIIVGISLSSDSHAFIQILENNQNSIYLRYDLSDFNYEKKEFLIRLKENTFSDKKLVLNINEKSYKINADIEFTNLFDSSKNIMGPFAYLPFMECKHHIISYKSNTNGHLQINKNKYEYCDDISYLEKDYGKSFPKNYTWIQGYNKETDSMLFLSIAKIPYLKMRFQGIISTVIIKGKVYNISTYNKAKILKNNQNEIIIKNSKYRLEINIINFKSNSLIAPVLGEMKKEIKECNTGQIIVKLADNTGIIFHEIFTNCGIEIVK